MKKRVITGMMTASVIVSLAGCGAGQKETVESTAPATMTETVAASQVETAEATETETTVQADRASRIWAKYALNISMNLPQAIIGCGLGGYRDSAYWIIFIRIIFCRMDQN